MLPIRNTADRWGLVTIGFHWLTVLLVAGMCVVGFLMQELPSGKFKVEVFALHKSFGLTLLAALKHHYLDRDRTLQRMLPAMPPAPPPKATAPEGE